MKAAVINKFGGPEVFSIRDLPLPAPDKDDVLIKVTASSINPIDWKIRKGYHKYTLGSDFPIIPGFDAAGSVIDTGRNVTRFKKGDAVYGRLDKKFGRAYSEYAIGNESVFAFKPPQISFEEAAAIPLASLTALQALRDKGKIKPNDNVLILGAAGGVGHFALQIARIIQARTVAVSSYRHKQLIETLKPGIFIDYTKENYKQLSEKFDIIFDAVGAESFLSCKHLLKPKGIYITTLPRPKLILHKLLALFTFGKKVRTLIMKARGKELEEINAWIENKGFTVHIDKVFPLDKIADAHRYSEEGHTEGKIVVKIS